MAPGDHDALLAHLDLQAQTLSAMVTLAHLDDSRTDDLIPEIRDQLDVMLETVDSLVEAGPR